MGGRRVPLVVFCAAVSNKELDWAAVGAASSRNAQQHDEARSLQRDDDVVFLLLHSVVCASDSSFFRVAAVPGPSPLQGLTVRRVQPPAPRLAPMQPRRLRPRRRLSTRSGMQGLVPPARSRLHGGEPPRPVPQEDEVPEALPQGHERVVLGPLPDEDTGERFAPERGEERVRVGVLPGRRRRRRGGSARAEQWRRCQATGIRDEGRGGVARGSAGRPRA